MGALHTLRTPHHLPFLFRLADGEATSDRRRHPMDGGGNGGAPEETARARQSGSAGNAVRASHVPAGQTATSFYFFPPPPSFGLSPGSVQARTIDEGLLIRRWGVRRYKYAAISLPTLSEQGRRRLRFLPLAVRFSRAVTHRTAGRRAGVTEERAFQTTSTERRSIRQEGAEDGAACPSTVHRGLFHSRYISTRRIQQTTLLVSRKQ